MAFAPPRRSTSPTRYTALQYRPYDAYPKSDLKRRAELVAKQSKQAWTTEMNQSYTAGQREAKQEATMRKGRVVTKSKGSLPRHIPKPHEISSNLKGRAQQSDIFFRRPEA